ELVDPGNLPRTLLRPFYGAQQRVVESLHTGGPVKGALGRVASPFLEIVDRAPVLVADVLQRLLITGDGRGQTLIPSDSEVERIPDHRCGVIEDLGDFLRASRSQRQAEQTAPTRALTRRCIRPPALAALSVDVARAVTPPAAVFASLPSFPPRRNAKAPGIRFISRSRPPANTASLSRPVPERAPRTPE